MPIVATARRGSAELAPVPPLLVHHPWTPCLIKLDLKGRAVIIARGLIKAKAMGKLLNRGRWV